MDLSGKEFVFDLDYDEQLGDLDDGEQNLEEEASRMLAVWNRDDLMREIEEEKEQINRENENKEFDYYDGETDFGDIIQEMKPIDGGTVYVKVVEEKPSEYEVVPFESSSHEGKPTKMNLLEGPILPGLLQGILTLREGERANIMVHPSMAYGPLGCPPIVPEDAYLFYQVKIYKVWEESQLEEIIRYEENNRTEVPLNEKLRFVQEHKDVANNFLRDDQPREAIIRYKAGIKCLEDLPPDIITNSKDVTALMTTLLQNVSIAFNKLGMHKSATKTAKRALFIDPTNAKVYYHLIKARIGLADYSGALNYIDKASQFCSDDRVFDDLRLQLNFQHTEEKRKREEIMKNMSKALQ